MNKEEKIGKITEEKGSNEIDLFKANQKNINIDENDIKKNIFGTESDKINNKEEEVISPKENESYKVNKNNFFIDSSFLYFIPNKKIIKKIENQENFSIFPQKDIFEEDEITFFSKIEPKGLQNLGGCCYMNATLQCFFHIKEFSDYFLKNKKYIEQKKGLISTGLLDLIEGLSRKDSKTFYIPKKFKYNLIKVDDSFIGSEGKDSGDLVSIILSSCQEELEANESDLADVTLDQRKQSVLFLDLYYKNSKAPSIINDLFIYYVRIENICFECGTKYYDISIEDKMVFSLEQVFRFNSSDITIKDYKRSVTLDNCLSYYSFGTSFDKNKYICKYCQKNACVFSVKSFATLPKYIIMLMKRGKNEKFECHVDFEENIDLSESYFNVEGIPKDKNTKYTILGGTILYGSKGYGHTVAFCKHFDGQYYIFNDSSFRKTSFDEIKNQKIYLLFYQKREE